MTAGLAIYDTVRVLCFLAWLGLAEDLKMQV